MWDGWMVKQRKRQKVTENWIEYVCEKKIDQLMTRLFQGGEQKPYRDEHSAPFGWKTRSQTNLAFDVYNSRWEINVDKREKYWKR